jgi:hypothetical protein
VGLALLTLLAAGSAATADIRPLLREQGFYNPLNGREQIAYVGHIRQDRNDYQVYVYKGVFRAAAVDHGVNRIIVILNGSTYVGSYPIGLPTKCNVRGQRVICDTESPGRVIQFTERGPPYEIWFDSEVLHFDFGDWKKRR